MVATASDVLSNRRAPAPTIPSTLASPAPSEFSDIGLALLANPEGAVSRVCMDILSSKGDDLGRALLLAQLMAPHCNDAQREHLRVASKKLLDEIGILGVDAVATLGALSKLWA